MSRLARSRATAVLPARGARRFRTGPVATVTTLACAALTLAAPVGAQQDPAALFVQVRGNVSVSRPAGATLSASVGGRAWAGDRIDVEPGARAVLLTRTGSRLVVSESTTVPDPRGAGEGELFTHALETLARAASADPAAGSRAALVDPIPGYTTLLRPRNGLSVSWSRPSFAWTSSPDPRYDVMLSRVGDGRPRIFAAGADTVWTLPDSVPELEADTRYVWTVFVGGRLGGRPLPQQEFRVISLMESMELRDRVLEIEQLGLDPAGDGLFLAAVAYRDAGLFYEAREALEGVRAEAPLSPDAYRLLGEVLAGLGDQESARTAFDRAEARSR